MRLTFLTVIFVTLASVAFGAPPTPPSSSGLLSGCGDNEIMKWDDATSSWGCEADAGASGGDSVSIDSSAVVDPDFVSTGDIDFVDTANTVTANINADAVGADELADGDLTDISVSGGAVTVESAAGDFAITGDLTVTGDDITMTTNTDTALLVADGTNFNPVVPSGDIEIDNAGVTNIANDTVGANELADGDLTDISVSGGVVTVESAASDFAVGGDLTVTGDDITMTTNTDTAILVADGTNFNPVVPSGDVSIDNAGATTVTDLTISSEAQGDVLYFDGTNWVRLAPGVAGQFLKTGGAAANPAWDDPAGSGDITAVGDGTSGEVFTADGAGNNLYFEGTTANTYEINVVGANPGADVTVTIPAETGTIYTSASTINGENIGDDTIDDDSIDFADVTGADLTLTDAGQITASGLITGNAGVTVATGQDITLGANVLNSGDLLDGEQIAADTIDDDSIDFTDVTLADITFDVGSVSTTEFGYLNGVTSAVQTQLDAKADIAGAENVSGVWEIQDDTLFNWGNDADFGIRYDETTDDQLEIVSNSASDTTIDISNAGAGDTNLVIDGDITYSGSLTYGGSGDSFITLSNNASYVGSGYQLFFEAGDLVSVENGTEKTVVQEEDGATFTGASYDFSAATNLEIPNGAASTADAAGEIAIDSDDNQFIWHDGAKTVKIDTTVTTDNYVLKYDNASATFNLEADATGGTPAWSDVTDPASDVTIDHDAGEETAFTFSGNYTTGPQFLVQQVTGNPTGGVLFEARGADSDSVVMEVGDGTNVWTVSTAGLLGNAGTATLNLAAVTDLTVAGGQIDYDDMAGSGNISTSGTAALGATTVTGVVNTSVGLDAVGAVDMDYGSADVTDHTFVTDSTGTAEIVLPAGAIDGTEILDDTIDSADYAAGSIDNEHLAANSVDSDQYVDGSIDAIHMSANSVDSDAYVDGSIDLAHMSANSVDSDQYVDGSIDAAHLATGAVYTATASKAAAYTIGTDDAKEMDGGIVYVTSAATITIPAVSAGKSFTVITIGATAVSLDPNASDKMYLDGVLLDDGDQATNNSSSGDLITCSYFSADGWYCASGGVDGTNWTDGG